MSRRTFTRRFRAEVGLRPGQRFTQQRVDLARQLLCLAERVGFGTGGYRPQGATGGVTAGQSTLPAERPSIRLVFSVIPTPPGTSVNIYDPVASIAAAIGDVRKRYGVAAYGSNLASEVRQFDPNRRGGGY
ncbi:hypothetical protein [Streptomyces sioyaensis]|uniref:hypothetical protein n=1 Tax=Streptomyces sioyaensis TaxID=67364 RepID=UPI0035ABB926